MTSLLVSLVLLLFEFAAHQLVDLLGCQSLELLFKATIVVTVVGITDLLPSSAI